MTSVARVSLRPMVAAELPSFREAFIRAWAEDLQRVEGLAERDAIERVTQEVDRSLAAAKPEKLLFVVVADGRAVGSLWLEIEDDGHGHIGDVTIDEAHRGRGYGRRALELAEEEARRAGATSMTLNVYADNEGARRLYADLGYRTTRLSLRKALDDPTAM